MCTDAYREALTRQFAATTPPAPGLGHDNPDSLGVGNTLSGPVHAAADIADPDDPSAER